MYDYLIVGLVALFVGYLSGAFVVARKVQRFLKKLPPDERGLWRDA